MRYIAENTDITQLSEMMKKNVNICSKKHYFYQNRCVLKVLTNTNDIQYLTIKPILNVEYTSNPNIIIENQPCFSQILEMRITNYSNIRRMTYENYKKQRLPMCQNKINQLLYKNPQPINCLSRFTIYPFFQEYAHIPAEQSYLP